MKKLILIFLFAGLLIVPNKVFGQLILGVVASSKSAAVPLGIQGTRTTTPTYTGTSHSITLPSNIVVGEMIFVLFSVAYANTISINTDVSGTNWTLSSQVDNGSDVSVVYAYKIAEGSNALTFTTPDSRGSAAISFRISSATTVYSASYIGTSINPDPPSLSPGGGSAEYVWIAMAGMRAAKTFTAAPTDYSNLTQVAASGSSASTIGSADRLYTTDNQDPGTFTLNAAAIYVSLTIAIK